jgi:GNAT superfamily N-acetyltransferase
MLTLVRTNSNDQDFISLVALLDAELKISDGEDHSFFAQFNKVDSIKEVVVGYWNEKAIGCGAFKPFESKTVEIKRMFVAPSHRGHGIAKKILGELEKWAGEIGNEYAILETGQKQPDAIALYLKSGYKIIPNYAQYANVENSVCMKKEI